MNIILSPESPVKPAVVIAKPVSVAFLLGASDAESNAPFCPEQYFVRHCDKVQYAVAFEKVRGASEMTRQFTKSVELTEAPADDESQRLIWEAQETEDLEEWLLDEEWMRRGC